MDGKSRILIVNFLGRIQVASKEKHRKAGGKAVQEFVGYFIGFCRSGEGSAITIHRSRPFSVLHKDYRQRTALKGYFFRMDRKTKILIASLLDRIEVALEKKYGKADFLDSKLLYGLKLVAGSGRILPSTIPFTAPFHPIK